MAAYNISKLPWYIGASWIPIPNYGLEASMPLHSLIGFRGVKLGSHPVLFLAPHVVMGAVLLTLYSVFLLGVDFDHRIYYALAVFFAIHVIPERAGFPNRTYFLPCNEGAVALVFLGSALAMTGRVTENVGMHIVFAPMLAALVIEMGPLLMCFGKQVLSNGKFQCESQDGNTPLMRNMNGYSGCPFAKRVDITTSEYPPSSNKKNE